MPETHVQIRTPHQHAILAADKALDLMERLDREMWAPGGVPTANVAAVAAAAAAWTNVARTYIEIADRADA